MASLSFNENILYTGRKPNFERDQFKTVADMAAFSENYLLEVFIAMCIEDGNVYIFNKKNELFRYKTIILNERSCFNASIEIQES